MDVNEVITKLSKCSPAYRSNKLMTLSDSDVRKALYLNANLLCSKIFVYKKPLDMEACYIPYSFREMDWNKSMNDDEEWIFMLNRHEYLCDLAIAFADSNDNMYLDCWKSLVFDWIERNPFEDRKLHTSWRTIDTGIRCASWVKSMLFIHEHLQEEELKKIFSSLHDQIIFLRHQYLERYTLSNWGTLQISGILQVLMVCEDLVPKEISDWAWEELERQCEIQFHLDGVHWEQSPLYHFEVLFALIDLYKLSQYSEVDLPFDIGSVIERAAHAAYYMIYPNGYLVPQHDSDYAFMENVLEELKPFQRSTLPNFFNGNESGNFIYKTERDFVSFWNGRHGSGHGHASLGHLNIFLNGERVLCDSGRFTYQDGPLRNYLKSAKSHSTVTVDDIPFSSIKDSWSYHSVGKSLGNRVKETKDYVVKEGAFSCSDYTVQRTVLTIKEESIVIVIDSVDCAGAHIMKRYFQVNPEMEVKKEEIGWKLIGRKNVCFAYFDRNQDTYSRKTISSPIYNQLVNRTTLIEPKEFVDHGIAFSIFSPKPLTITKNRVHCEEEEAPSEEYFLSFTIKSDSNCYDICFIANDSCDGSKMFKHKDEYYYHKLTILQNGKKEIIF